MADHSAPKLSRPYCGAPAPTDGLLIPDLVSRAARHGRWASPPEDHPELWEGTSTQRHGRPRVVRQAGVTGKDRVVLAKLFGQPEYVRDQRIVSDPTG